MMTGWRDAQAWPAAHADQEGQAGHGSPDGHPDWQAVSQWTRAWLPAHPRVPGDALPDGEHREAHAGEAGQAATASWLRWRHREWRHWQGRAVGCWDLEGQRVVDARVIRFLGHCVRDCESGALLEFALRPQVLQA